MTTHTCFKVTVAPHEADDPSWRIRHAGETFGIVKAYFDYDENSFEAVQSPDGSFVIHAPTRTTMDTLRSMIADHEGLTIVEEFEVDGDGYHPKDLLEATLSDAPVVRVDDKIRCICGVYADGRINCHGDAACEEWPGCVTD